MSPVLRGEHLLRRLAGEAPVTLVDDVSLEVQRGEFICIMGPSGSGKSSLLYLLGLLDSPDAGKLWLDGEDTSGCDDDRLAALRLAKLGFVFQFHFLLAEFTIVQNVLLPMQRLGRRSDDAAQAAALAMLERLGIAEQAHKYPSQLSGGQRQRAALARALANDPLLILADEPTGNLDSAATLNVRSLLRGLADAGQTVVAVTHDAEFASAADRCIGLVDGRIAPRLAAAAQAAHLIQVMEASRAAGADWPYSTRRPPCHTELSSSMPIVLPTARPAIPWPPNWPCAKAPTWSAPP